MLAFSIWFIYFLIGFTWARFGVVKKKNLIWDDTGIHMILLTILWLPLLFCGAIYLGFIVLAKVIDPVIRKF